VAQPLASSATTASLTSGKGNSRRFHLVPEPAGSVTGVTSNMAPVILKLTALAVKWARN
jgi:hypothetical protein